jgi:hypothetical protein
VLGVKEVLGSNNHFKTRIDRKNEPILLEVLTKSFRLVYQSWKLQPFKPERFICLYAETCPEYTFNQLTGKISM